MPKGYWIAHVTVNNADMYPDYIRTAAARVPEIWRAFSGARRTL